MLPSRRLSVLLIVFTVALAGAACQKRQQVVGTGNIADALPTMMGEAETRARDYLFEMADLLNSHVHDPDQAIQRMRAFIRVNRDDMAANAAALQSTWDSLDGFESRVYEAQFAAFIGEGTVAWVEAKRAFELAHPSQVAIIQEIVANADNPER
jgi:hypothetical protein